jgi:AraC-like DNA-binding protein
MISVSSSSAGVNGSATCRTLSQPAAAAAQPSSDVPACRAFPRHLSRLFRELAGSSVSHYRNRGRVSRAVDRILQGETDLAGLAAELRFADHAHLTRTIQRFTGKTPTAWRQARSGGGSASGPN